MPKSETVLVNEREAAKIIGMSVSWIQQSRRGIIPNAPPFIKFGRNVRYSKPDLESWISKNRRTPKSE